MSGRAIGVRQADSVMLWVEREEFHASAGRLDRVVGQSPYDFPPSVVVNLKFNAVKALSSGRPRNFLRSCGDAIARAWSGAKPIGGLHVQISQRRTRNAELCKT